MPAWALKTPWRMDSISAPTGHLSIGRAKVRRPWSGVGFDGAVNVEQGDIIRGAGEGEAACGAFLRGDKPGLHERGKEASGSRPGWCLTLPAISADGTAAPWRKAK